jgi:hypothetical protein
MSSEHYAYGPEWAEVEAVMRFHAVKRWHMIDTTRVQTLAEHSANVAALAYVVAIRAPGLYFGPAYHVAGRALFHDIDEVFTGDIPTHTKRHLEGLKKLEADTTPDIFKPAAMGDAAVATLIKFCDLADGIRFIRLHGVDITSRHAKEGLERQYRDKVALTEWPLHVLDHVVKMTTFYAYEQS